MNPNGIVVFGAVFVDIKGYPLAQYIPGGRNVGRVVQVHGGVSRNVAEDIANVELRPTFVSVVDQTGIGTDVIEKLKRHKVNTSYIRRTPDGLGTWLAVFNNAGDVTASISKRPDLSGIRDMLLEKGDEIISRADSVVVEIDMESDILSPIFNLCEKYDKPVFAVVSNMGIAVERRDKIMKTACFVCNLQEAAMMFSTDFAGLSPDGVRREISMKAALAHIPRMVVTMGEEGAVWCDRDGTSGVCPAVQVDVVDTTGAGDSFFAGVAVGLTYGKNLAQACVIGSRLAASVIATRENVCPRFLPAEFDLDLG